MQYDIIMLMAMVCKLHTQSEFGPGAVCRTNKNLISISVSDTLTQGERFYVSELELLACFSSGVKVVVRVKLTELSMSRN